ncbi:MAG: MnmC family methyltransferase [Jaaginema sp. PMC 1079.18]|nr:MnmC family methyltransferase [Jaaginema sp. PMC 1080.18]MEC4851127.1 MnmC family methyltransferase [Jaaginema sp. PMC 1079.18]MEC4868243.1 MnmC family methyltransferase [Jaaginema sp. PMC 1078.18]
MQHYFTPQLTEDGSFTFFSSEFDEAFHSHYGARQEAFYKFVKPCLLADKARQQKCLVILDICYGLGYNSAAAIATIWQQNPHCQIQLIALESDLGVPQAAIAQNLLTQESPEILAILTEIAAQQQCNTEYFQGNLLIADARIAIQKLRAQKLQADAIFLDPFSPPKCPQLWTVEFITQVAACLKLKGRLATYSCASSVRNALAETGLHFGSSTVIGRKTPGTVASWSPEAIPALSEREREHLQTRASIPYRDPTLAATATVIKENRQHEQRQSDREPTRQWKKRWRSQ